MKNTLHIVFQALKIALIKITKVTATSLFISFCFALAFTSADIIFHKLLELNSTLSEKRFLWQIFLFNGLTETAHPP